MSAPLLRSLKSCERLASWSSPLSARLAGGGGGGGGGAPPEGAAGAGGGAEEAATP